jgi:acetyltransferase
LIKLHGVNDAEFALLVSDRWQELGLGTYLLKLLLSIGGQEGIENIIGQMLPDNQLMQRICRKLGFALRDDEFAELVEAKIEL